MRRGALLTAAVVTVAGGIAWFLPWLLEERDVLVATPAAPPLFQAPALVDLEPGEEACVSDVAFDPEAEEMRFTVGTFGRPGQPLVVELRAGGYRDRIPVAPGYPDNATLEVPIATPGEAAIGRACIVNSGDARVALYANDEERTRSRVEVTVGGRPVDEDIVLSFWKRGRSSHLAQVPEAVDRMALFRPVGPWFGWLMLALVLIALPALAVWAIQRAFDVSDPNAATSRKRSPTSRG